MIIASDKQQSRHQTCTLVDVGVNMFILCWTEDKIQKQKTQKCTDSYIVQVCGAHALFLHSDHSQAFVFLESKSMRIPSWRLRSFKTLSFKSSLETPQCKIDAKLRNKCKDKEGTKQTGDDSIQPF